MKWLAVWLLSEGGLAVAITAALPANASPRGGQPDMLGRPPSDAATPSPQNTRPH